MKLLILGPPRTKKTHQRILRTSKGVPFIASAKTSASWEARAIQQLDRQRGVFRYRGAVAPGAPPPIDHNVSVRALIYRDANRGDLTGYLQAIGDALELAGVLANDKLIHSWDGSRKLIDRVRPRVEIEIEAMA